MDPAIGYFHDRIHNLYLFDSSLARIDKPDGQSLFRYEYSLWRVTDYLNGRGAERWRR